MIRILKKSTLQKSPSRDARCTSLETASTLWPNSYSGSGPLLRNRNLGGKFQKGDLIFDTRNISLYELLSKACISYKTLIVLEGSSPLFCRSSFCSGWGEDLWKAQGQENMGLL